MESEDRAKKIGVGDVQEELSGGHLLKRIFKKLRMLYTVVPAKGQKENFCVTLAKWESAQIS